MPSTIDATKPLTNSLVTSSVLRALAAAAKFDIEALQTAVGAVADPLTKVLTGFTASTGTITSADTILSAIEKLYGNKDTNNGYAGLTLLKINFKNVANTFTSFLTNTNTAIRTYTFPDKDITVAGLVDLVGKNLLINPAFIINQRAVSGTVTLAANIYGHDRWKAGASGCTYTFAITNGLTTLTITAGSLIQVVEDVNVPYGTNTLVLSWTGTAQGKIGAGSYSTSGITGSVSGGVNLNVEFNTGTLSLVQLEKSGFPTSFEQRPYTIEFDMCRRYFEYIKVGAAYTQLGVGYAITTTTANINIKLYPKRANPTSITVISGVIWCTSGAFVATLGGYLTGKDNMTLTVNTTGLTIGQVVVFTSLAVDTGGIQVGAEL